MYNLAPESQAGGMLQRTDPHAAVGYPQDPPPSYFMSPNMSAPMQFQTTPNIAGTSASYSQQNPAGFNSSQVEFQPPARTSECVSKVELTVKCNNLLDMDVFSKSDPIVVVYIETQGHWIERGRTEMIQNCLNPEFSKKILLEYYFEETQKLRFSVYDIDNVTPSLEDDDFLGQMECTLGQIVSGSPFTRNLVDKNGGKMGQSTITIYVEELDTGHKDLLTLSFTADRLSNLRWFSKSSPFLEFHRREQTGHYRMIHRSEPVHRCLCPVWKTFEIRRQLLGGTDVETKITIKCFDYKRNGSHELIGECDVTLQEILAAIKQKKQWPCINSRKKQQKGSSYSNSGFIILEHCQITKTYSFLEYILGGTQINFTVAIDFTASNGDPANYKSLHYIHSNKPNDYIKAILAVGGVVQDYDTDKMFPALGFGARIPPHYQVSHEFALNFNPSNPFCSGVQGLLDAYCTCLRQVQLYGPTNFAPVIDHVAQFALKAHQQSTPENYFILLILTDGVVTDMQNTLSAVVKASYLPLSIIIIGVGKADFEQMEFLDSDNQLLKAPDGTVAKRDIVQFVPFYKFEHGDPAKLAKEVLAELPQQLTDYYRWRNIPPKAQLERIS